MDVQTMLSLASKNDPATVDALVELGVLIESNGDDEFEVNEGRLSELKLEAFPEEWIKVEQIIHGALSLSNC